MATIYTKRGSNVLVGSDLDSTSGPLLEAGYYTVAFNDEMGFFFKINDPFEVPTRLYGDVDATAERFLNTFVERSKRKLGTGVLLVGCKGSGKSLTAKLTCAKAVEMGYPVIQVSNRFAGGPFLLFMQMITQPCVVLFDEFEKVYGRYNRENVEDGTADHYAQEQLLGLFDGPFSGEKLMILTANDRWSVDSHFLNRPGRLFYALSYHGLEEDFIREYCQENLKDASEIEAVVSLSFIFKDFNFDMLQAVVEECNRYGEPVRKVLKLLNIEPDPMERVDYDVEVVRGRERFFVSPARVNRPLSSGVTTLDVHRVGENGMTHGKAEHRLRVDFAMESATNRDRSTLVVEKEGYKITLTRQKEPAWDYERML